MRDEKVDKSELFTLIRVELTIYLCLAAVASWTLVMVLAFAKAALNWRKRRRGDC